MGCDRQHDPAPAAVSPRSGENSREGERTEVRSQPKSAQNLARARTYQVPPLKPKGERSPYCAPTMPAHGLTVG